MSPAKQTPPSSGLGLLRGTKTVLWVNGQQDLMHLAGLRPDVSITREEQRFVQTAHSWAGAQHL